MAGKDFLEEQRRRQRDLVATKTARQNPSAVPAAVVCEQPVLTPKDKLKNFWFYYKYHILAIVFLAFVLTIGISQCATKEKYDIEVVLFTYSTYTGGQIDALEEQLELYGEDTNGDGEVNVQVIDCSYNKDETADQQNAKRSKLTALIAADSNALLFITDEASFEYFDTLFEKDFFATLDLPDNDGKSALLSETFCKAVNDKSESGFLLPEGLRISRRVADENTAVGRADNIGNIISASDSLIKRLIAE